MSTQADVRRWATMERRLNIPARGRLSPRLIEAFNAVHPDDPCPINTRGMIAIPSRDRLAETSRRREQAKRDAS